MYKILIAEDDGELNVLFQRVLIKNGYDVKGVSNGKMVIDALSSEYFDLIISDIMMPELDGYDLVNYLRESGRTIPVLVITAKDTFDDMKLAFAVGADDYMVKPVNVNEMVVRVNALLRRAQMINDRKLVIGSTVLECDSLTVTTGGESSILPQKEFMLLYKMASYPGKTFTRKQLMDDIWGYENDWDTHTVDVHINRLRDRFKNCEDFKIITIRGLGYKVVRV
ncbi:MAG: response regulator transcription factor [Clostridia bacterium]|nr:response regulator transcription factor [Clostridia bacterium]